VSRPDRFPDWPTLAAAAPGTTATMRRIANRTVAGEYFAVTAKVEALYGPHNPLRPT
jgi:hypothetical protein